MNNYPNGPYPPQPGQGPYTQYPPQTGYLPPMQPGYPQMPPQQPMRPPKKPMSGWAIAGIIIGIIFLLAALGSVVGKDKPTETSNNTSGPTDIGNNPTPTPTATPTPVPRTWQTTHTYTGNGDKQTETITVVDDWKIQWSCQADDAPLYVSIYNADTKDMTDWSAVSTTCKNAPTTGETIQHTGGNIYLSIISGIDWTITIQELK